MKIEKYISGLLYRYQCVSVPGFGAFLCEWQSAQIAEAQNSFVPPKKIISFNSNIKTNDGLLANHISLQEKIAYEKALEKIQNQVACWLEKLENKEVLVLENIGEIFSNTENNLVFKPNNSVNYLTDSFGLSGFNSPEIIREVVNKQEENQTNIITLTETEESDSSDNVVQLTEIKPNRNWIKYAAAVAVFSSLTTFGYKTYYDFTINQKTLLVQKSVQEKVNQKLQEATFVLPNPVTSVDLTLEETTVASTSNKYHLIANAFRSLENAEKHKIELQNKGYNATVFKSKKYNLYNVTYGSFTNIQKAEEMKIKLKTQGVTNYWLHID